MVGLEILIRIPSEKRQEFLQAIEWFTKRRKKESACIDCTIFEEIGTPNRFLWVEQWVDFKSMNEHLGTDHFKALKGAIQVLGELNSLHVAEIKVLNDLSG